MKRAIRICILVAIICALTGQTYGHYESQIPPGKVVVRDVTLLKSDMEPLTWQIVESGESSQKANVPTEEKNRFENINEYVTLSGALELEAVFGKNFEGERFSDVAVAAVELELDVQATDWATGHILTKYDGDAEDSYVSIDVATIRLGNSERTPLFMTAGKFYMPFGNFATHMVQDPLPLEIGEVGETGIALGLEQYGFFGNVFSYKGMIENGTSDTIDGFGAQGGYHFKQDSIYADVGIGWVNNIADSDGITQFLDENGIEKIEERVAGMCVHLTAGYGHLVFIGEYVQAMEEFANTEIAYNIHGAQPKAWNVEIAYNIGLNNRETTFAIGYQESREAVCLGLPESRIIGAVEIGIFKGTSLTLEYFHDNDYDKEYGGTGKSNRTFTTQLIFGF